MSDVTEAAATVRSAFVFARQAAAEHPEMGYRADYFDLSGLDLLVEQAERAARWLAWSGGQYPDDSPGDVIAAYQDGTIVLDDGITTWNPVRACAYFARRAERAASLRDALERLVADLETNSAQGAPLYAHNALIVHPNLCPEHGIHDCSPLLNGCSRLSALAAGSEGERIVCAACGGKWDGQTTSCEECGGQTATAKGET